MGSDIAVVITGIGILSSLGSSLDEYWNNIINGVSGVHKVERFDPTDYPCKVAAEVRNFDPAKYMDAKEVKRNDRYTHYAMAASKIAIEDSGLDVTKVESRRFGVLIGSGIGGMETIELQTKRLFTLGPRRVSPFMIPSLIANIASGVVAIEMGAKGPNYGIVSACASGAHALGESLHMIRAGKTDVMLAGGSEASITQIGYAGFCSMKAMSTSYNDTPERASRPFDSGRDGFVMGEGSGILLLESREHAEARGAKIYCELSGYGASCDAYHITSPDPEGAGLAYCLRIALEDAGVEAKDIDYINAHGTSTPYNDKFETKAIKTVFGDHANKALISSTKSMTGHLLGAAGAIEAAVCVKALQTGLVPPTINYDTPDPECDLSYVPNEKVEADIKVAVSNNLGFGGHNASLVLKKHN